MLSRAIPRSTLRLKSSPSSVRFASNSAARPHPLASRATPSGPVPAGSTPSGLKPRAQKWSTATLILLATLTGTGTYIAGVLAGGDKAGSNAGPAASGVKEEVSQATFEEALTALAKVLPGDGIDRDRDSLVSHGHSSWSSLDPRGLPGAVLYPRHTADVVAIVNVASQYGIPLIPFSGGTSLEGQTGSVGLGNSPKAQAKVAAAAEKERARKAGGAALAAGEASAVAVSDRVTVDDLEAGRTWVLDFAENMNQVVAIHQDDLDIVVQPGISYGAVNEILAEHAKEAGKNALFFPVDPAPGAMIGGIVGTNASGTNAVKYGVARDNVLSLTVVLPNGEVIKTRSRAKKSSVGPDLTKLFVGSEGTLGIVTEATLKLHPVLPTSVAVSSFPTVEKAALAVRDLVQNGVDLACIELVDEQMIKCMNKAGGPITWPESPALFLKFTGRQESMQDDIKRTKKIAATHSGSGFTFARNNKEAEEIWYSRKVALWSVLEYDPGARVWVTDVCVPISAFPSLMKDTKADLDREGILGPICGHAGDGNFHSLMIFKNEEERTKVDALVHRMVDRAQALEGTATGEHGVGFGKSPFIEAELGAGTIELLRNIKETIDPKNIMNPNKLLPPRGAAGGAH